MNPSESLYPIREVSKLTGVNAITLRAWERRYGLIEPIRTDSGHRLYSQRHIERIQAAIELTEQGIPISQVGQMLDNRPMPVDNIESSDETRFEKLLEKVLARKSADLNAQLTQLFAELPDQASNRLLRKTTLDLKHHHQTIQPYWETMLLPRLYSRFHFALQSLPNSAPTLWLHQPDNRDNDVLIVLVALWLCSQGLRPIIRRSSMPVKADVDLVQASDLREERCIGLALVCADDDFDDTYWLSWSKQHPSLEFYGFIAPFKATSPLSHQLQCHLFDLNESF